MLKKLLILNLFFILNTLVLSSQQHQSAKLVVLKTPKYQTYDFSNESPLKLSDFKNLLLSTSGFSTEKFLKKPVEWTGFKKDKKKSTKFPRITILFLADSNHTDVDAFSTQQIKVQEDTEVDFEYLKSSTNGYDSLIKFYDNLPSESDLKSLQEDCSHSSATYIIRVPEAQSSNLVNAVDEVLSKFSTNCVSDSQDLLVYLLATNGPVRVKRQTVQDTPALNVAENRITNEATFYSDQYPAMFNLIFWTSLILALAVYGITYSMWNMDPGLDTVIYRMTSQRIKKDQ